MGGIKLKNEDGSLNDKETMQVKEEATVNDVGGAIIEETTASERQTFEDPAVLYREEERTDAYSEHYVMNNGTAKTVISAKPVNYYDEETKKWEKIDLTAKEKDGYYESRAGSVAARFSKPDAETDAQKVEMVSGKQTISWEYVGKASDGTIKSRMKAAALRMNKSEDKSETAVYEEAESNTDIEYAFDGKNLKENIIVREKADQYKYNFIMDTHGLNVRLSENNDSIEVYTAEDKAKGIEEKVEFYIPSPVMWDAVGKASEEVYYEIGKSADGRYEFSVIASEEWINAEERVFPITIDPQIVTDTNSLFTYQVQRATLSSVVGSSLNWTNVSGISYIKVSNNNTEVYRTRLTIKRGWFIVPNNRVIKVNIILTPKAQFFGNIGINKKYLHYNTSNGRLEYDITDIFTSTTSNFIIEFEPICVYNELINGSFDTPIIEVEYLTDESTQATKKSYSLAGVANSDINITTGDMTVDFCDIQGKNSVFGLDVYHVYKRSSQNYYTGKNFRLNLHETFIKNNNSALDANYIYTDGKGDKHGFKDYYYFFNGSGNKEYLTVPKTNIEVEADGTLRYNGKIIYAEYKSASGLQAVTQYEDFKFVSHFEQRSDEIQQIEEKVINYGNALKEFVVLRKDNGQICNRFEDYLSTASEFDLLISYLGNDNLIVLTESEALTYSSLVLQVVAIDNQIASYNHQRTGFNLSKVSMQKQIDTMNNTVLVESAYHNLYTQTVINNDIKQNLASQINLTDVQDGDVVNIKNNTLCQKDNILSTIYNYANKKSKYITQIQAYYKIYYSALNEQKEKYRQMPVNFLTDGKLIKGYNKFGDLVSIQDGYENYSIIEYESVNGSLSDYRISRIYDNSDRLLIFSYSADNKLSYITDVFGRRTQFEYLENQLNGVKFNTGEQIRFEYADDNIVAVNETKNQLRTSITYSGNKPVNIINKSLTGEICDGDYNGLDSQINSIALSYYQTGNMTMESMFITQDNVREEYNFGYYSNVLTRYAKEVDNLVVEAEKYEYVPYWVGDTQQQNPRKVVIKADSSCLNIAPLSRFSFVDGETQISALNQFNNPTTTTVSGIKLNADGTNTLTSVTTYTYDNNQRVIEEQTSEQYTNMQYPIVSYVRYNYNTSGDVIRKESFVDGEEYTNGKTIEETVYDDKGNVIKTFTYNTLDASSKYYTEKKFDEDGKVISEANDSGENCTEYEYAENSGELNTVKHVKGSKFSYGRDADGTVISITQSDENGEGNSTELSYTCGELTKATSGNNTVKYTYDGKRRITRIDLNGTAEYLKNTYTDNVSYSGLTLNVVETENKKEEKFKRWFYKSGEVKQVDYNSDAVLLYDYNAKMQVTSVSDSVASITHTYLYDGLDRQIKHSFGTNSTETEFDAFGSVSKTTYKFSAADSDKVEYAFTYSEDSKRILKRLAVGAFTEDYETDALGRTKTVVKTFGNKTYESDYGYYKVGDHATNLINTVYRLNDGITEDKTTYTYDGAGNIVSINENGRQKYKYIYDSLGRLISEKDLWNNKETVYTYDNKGNILTKTVDGVVTRYRYAKGTDKLVSYGNESFVYDDIGNPTTFRNMTATWTKGRQLTSLSDGTNTVSYTYDGFGLRKSKSVGGITTEYIYVDGKLLRQTGSNTIDFIYGADGITGIKVGDASYLFIKNIQGDIEKIINANGDIVGEYAYTAYGECTIITNTGNIAEINPIRYRGYYYDEETSLYYLKSRYYDPELGRFMTVDDISYIDIETINGLNLYAYCGNNPVMNIDTDGNFFIGFLMGLLVAAAVGAIVGAGSYVIGQIVNYAITGNFEWSWGGFLGATIGGAIGGAIAFVLSAGLAVGVAIGGFFTTLGTMLGENISGDANYSIFEILGVSALSAFISGISAGILDKIKISMFNVGRGSFKAISQQLFTKFKHGIIIHISLKSFGKILAINAYYSSLGEVIGWFYKGNSIISKTT